MQVTHETFKQPPMVAAIVFGPLEGDGILGFTTLSTATDRPDDG